MLVGEYPWDSMDKMDDMQLPMFLVWLFMYTLIVFFTLLNFLLAIIVDSFIEVKQEIMEQVTENSFPEDCADMCKDCFCRLFVPGYPDIRKVRVILEEAEGMDQKIREIYNEERNKKSDIEFHYPLIPDEFYELCGPKIFKDIDSCEKFLVRYGMKIPDMVFPMVKVQGCKMIADAFRQAATSGTAFDRQSILDDILAVTDKKRKRRETREKAMDPTASQSPRHDENPMGSITFDSLASMNVTAGASARLKSAAFKRRQNSQDALNASAGLGEEGFQSCALGDVELDEAANAEAEKAEKIKNLGMSLVMDDVAPLGSH